MRFVEGGGADFHLVWPSKPAVCGAAWFSIFFVWCCVVLKFFCVVLCGSQIFLCGVVWFFKVLVFSGMNVRFGSRSA